MGQKVNPQSMRLQVTKNWQSKWFASKSNYTKNLGEDLKLRTYLKQNLERRAGIDKVEIERSRNQITVTLYTARPGVVIGRGGAGIDELKLNLAKLIGSPVRVVIEEIKKPELRAQLVADNVASQLERRISFRRAIKATAEASMRAGAKGVKIVVAGRLNNAEMARTEKELLGSIPLHTLRADIDYGHATARTSAGITGVKVWIYKEGN